MATKSAAADGGFDRIHRIGRQFERKGPIGGKSEYADGSDVFIGVNEQPFPIEPDDLDPQRRLVGLKR